MRIFSIKFNQLAFFLLLALFTSQANAKTEKLNPCLEKATTPLAKMECFRGFPYRIDGALDENGRWTTWADQNKEFTSAGLNCSGLTTAISRSIWGQTPPLSTLMHDRLDDSGPEAPMGEDWDFGIDLILNLTEDLPRRLIPNPYENKNVDSALWNALDLRGVDVNSPDFPKMLAEIQPENIYYFVISKPDGRFKGGISFYHVGLILKEDTNIWMYHATAKGGVYRVNLAGDQGLAWFRRYYGASSKGPRYIQLIEVPLTTSVNINKTGKNSE